MDISDMCTAVPGGNGKEHRMIALTKHYFEKAYESLDEADIMKHWFDALKQMNPPPSGLDIQEIVSDDMRKSVLWKKAVEKLAYRLWKCSWRLIIRPNVPNGKKNYQSFCSSPLRP